MMVEPYLALPVHAFLAIVSMTLTSFHGQCCQGKPQLCFLMFSYLIKFKHCKFVKHMWIMHVMLFSLTWLLFKGDNVHISLPYKNVSLLDTL